MKLIKRNDDWGFPSTWEDFFNNDLFNFPAALSRGRTIPAVNISENDKDFIVEVAAPAALMAIRWSAVKPKKRENSLQEKSLVTRASSGHSRCLNRLIRIRLKPNMRMVF